MSKLDPTFQVTLAQTMVGNSASPQPQIMPEMGQVAPLPQGDNQQQADQEIYIVILPGIQEPQEEKLKTEEAHRAARPQTTKPSNSSLSRPKTRVAAKRGHATSASAVRGGCGGRLGAIKENIVNTQHRPVDVSLTRRTEGKKALQTLQAVSTHTTGAGLVASQSQKPTAEQSPQAVGQSLAGPGPRTAAATLAPTPQQLCVNIVNTLNSASPKLCIPHSGGLQSPMAASTPLYLKQLAARPAATESRAQDSPGIGNSFKPVSTSTADLQQDCALPVPSLEHFSSPILPWPDGSRSQVSTGSTPSSKSISTSTPVSKTKSSGLGAGFPSTTQPEASAVSSPVDSEEPLGTFFTSETVGKPSSSQLSTCSQSSADRRPVSSMDFQHEETQDSGIGVSLGSAAPTSTGVESDFGATCSSWATSEDSNQMVIDFNVDSVSQGSTEDNSNSQGDDGEMNTSLTKMYWLNDFALKKKRTGSENLLSPEVSTSRHPESRHGKSLCICDLGRRFESEFDKKPPYRYKHLIEMALLSRKDHTMTSSEIRMWFVQNFPFFKRHEKCGFWQNAIRHNLSSNDCFVKNKIKKRHWTLDLSLSIRTEEGFSDSVPLRVPLSAPVATRPVAVRSAVHGSVRPDTVMLQSLAQPMVIGSGLSTSSTATVPCTFQPILPRPLMPNQIALLNVNNLPPSYFQQHPSLLLHIPPSPVENPPQPNSAGPVYPLSSVAVAAPVPKLPLPPLSAAACSSTPSASSVKKSGTGAVSKVKPAKQAVSRGRRRMRKTKSAGACGENNVLVQAAIQSGLKQALEQSQHMELWENGPINSVHTSPNIDPEQGNAVLTGGCRGSTGSGNHGKNPLVRSASLPPILSKRVKVSHLSMPLDEPNGQGRTDSGQPHSSMPPDELVDLERTSCGQLQLRSRGRRKQNFPVSETTSSDIIISNSGSANGDTADKRDSEIPCRADCSEQAANDSLCLAGPQAGCLQLSPLVTPPHDNPKLSQAVLDSPTSGLSLTLDTSTPIKQPKIRMEPLPSPIGGPTALLGNPAPMDNSLMDMLDGIGFPGENLFSNRRDSTPRGDSSTGQKGVAAADNADETDGHMPGLTTPPSACLKTSQNWSMKSFGDNSLGLLVTPGGMDLGMSNFSNLLDFPDDLSLVDQSPEGARCMGSGPQCSTAGQLLQNTTVDVHPLDGQQCSTAQQASCDQYNCQRHSVLQQASCDQQYSRVQQASSNQCDIQQQSSHCQHSTQQKTSSNQQSSTVQQIDNEQCYHSLPQSCNNQHIHQQFCAREHASNGQRDIQQQVCDSQLSRQLHKFPEQASSSQLNQQQLSTVKQASSSRHDNQEYHLPQQSHNIQHNHQQFSTVQQASNSQHDNQEYHLPQQSHNIQHNHQQFSTAQQASNSQHDNQQHCTVQPGSSGQHNPQQIGKMQHNSCGQHDSQRDNRVLPASSYNSYQRNNQPPHAGIRDNRSPCADPQLQISGDLKVMQEAYASSHGPPRSLGRPSLSRNLFPQGEPKEVGSHQKAQHQASAQPAQLTPPAAVAHSGEQSSQSQLTQQTELTEQAPLSYQVQQTPSSQPAHQVGMAQQAQQSQPTKWILFSQQPQLTYEAQLAQETQQSHFAQQVKVEQQSQLVGQVQVIQPTEQPKLAQQVQLAGQSWLICQAQQAQSQPFYQVQPTQLSQFTHQSQQAQQSRLIHEGQGQLAHQTQQHHLVHLSKYAHHTQTQYTHQNQLTHHPFQSQQTQHFPQTQHALRTQQTQQSRFVHQAQQSQSAYQAQLAQQTQFTQSQLVHQLGLNSSIATPTENSAQRNGQVVLHHVMQTPGPASAIRSGLNSVQQGTVSRHCHLAPRLSSEVAGLQQNVHSSPQHSPGPGQLPGNSQGGAPASVHSGMIVPSNPTTSSSHGSTPHQTDMTAARGSSNARQFSTAGTAESNHSRMDGKGSGHTDFTSVEDKGFEMDANVGIHCSGVLAHSSHSLAISKSADATRGSSCTGGPHQVNSIAPGQEQTTVVDSKHTTVPKFFEMPFEPPAFATHQFSINDSFLSHHANRGACQPTAGSSTQSGTNQNVALQDCYTLMDSLNGSITGQGASVLGQNPINPSENTGALPFDHVGVTDRTVPASRESVAVRNQGVDMQQQMAAYQSLDAAQHVSVSPSGSSSYMSAFFDSLINTPPSKEQSQQYYSGSYPTSHFSAQ